MLDIARKRLPEVKFVELDIFDLTPLSTQKNVICLHVLQHLPHYGSALPQLVKLATNRLYVVTWFNETDSDEIRMSRDSDAEPTFYTNVYSLPKFVATFRQLVEDRDATVTAKHLTGNAFAVSAEFGSL